MIISTVVIIITLNLKLNSEEHKNKFNPLTA